MSGWVAETCHRSLREVQQAPLSTSPRISRCIARQMEASLFGRVQLKGMPYECFVPQIGAINSLLQVRINRLPGREYGLARLT